jgi:light-regulated signal transduction histidine kinase (bacteriophytochrome)
MEEHKTLFRTKAMDRIASPDQLTEYLRVTNPGIWAVLAAVILLLAGIFAWSMVGTLETTADVTAVVEDHEARIVPAGAETLAAGMPLWIAGQEFILSDAETDLHGRVNGRAEVLLPDGTYEGKVVVEISSPRKGRVTLIVSNSFADGKDMHYERFFERFYRDDEAHSDEGGYGIGLSVAESICDRYRGSIKASWKAGMVVFTCQLRSA